MILDRILRETIVNKLKADANLTSVVNPDNILNFPVKGIDSINFPSIGVFTLQSNDESNTNDPEHNNLLSFYIETSATTVEQADDIELLINSVIVVDPPWGESYGGITQGDVQTPYFTANKTEYDLDGETIRVAKTTNYSVRYESVKGDYVSVDTLNSIHGEMIYEDEPGSQIDNELEVDLT